METGYNSCNNWQYHGNSVKHLTTVCHHGNSLCNKLVTMETYLSLGNSHNPSDDGVFSPGTHVNQWEWMSDTCDESRSLLGLERRHAEQATRMVLSLWSLKESAYNSNSRPTSSALTDRPTKTKLRRTGEARLVTWHQLPHIKIDSINGSQVVSPVHSWLRQLPQAAPSVASASSWAQDKHTNTECNTSYHKGCLPSYHTSPSLHRSRRQVPPATIYTHSIFCSDDDLSSTSP